MVIKTMPNKSQQAVNSAEHNGVSKEVLVIAQEIKIVKSLACNDLIKRNRQLKRLQKWLRLRTRSSFPFTAEDFRRMWKGLYYTMWMSDKPLVQEELAEQLGKLLLCFDGNIEASTNFFGAFLYTMYHQWFGIDQWRLDKFMMLVRRMLRYMLRVLKSAGWPSEGIKIFNEHLAETVLAEKVGPAGLTMHYLDIFCEELAKVSKGDISADEVGQFIRPFVDFYCTQRDFKLTSHCRARIFNHLLYQSALGRDYVEKYNAWKEMGFPTASINDLEKVDENEDEDTMEVDEEDNEGAKEVQQQQHLDPRAGNIDVFIPELPLDAKHIIEPLEPFVYKNECSTKRRKLFKRLLEICQTYQNGEFPLGVKTMPRINLEPKAQVIAEKMKDLDEVENELYGVGRQLKQLNKRKRRKLLKSINLDNADENNFDEIVAKAIPKSNFERKRKARDELMNGWIEEELDEEISAPEKKKAKKMKKDKLEAKVMQAETPQLKKQADSNVSTIKKQPKKEKVKENGVVVTKNIHTAQTAPAIQTITPTKTLQAPKVAQATQQITSTSTPTTPTTKPKTQIAAATEWDTPLVDGEIEYFMPSRKLTMKRANSELVLNPLAMKKKFAAAAMLSQQHKSTTALATSSPRTPAGSAKRVKIALKHNTAQNPSEYIRQVKCSPDVPYDANRKPGKGLLKPHSVPSPINPFYKKKIGLRLLNDTM